MVQSFAEHMVLEQELRALYTEPQVGRQAGREIGSRKATPPNPFHIEPLPNG